MIYIAEGEFGTETVEADTLHEAANKVAEGHAGLDCDEICQDPWSFTIAPSETPLNAREFRAEWTPWDGLEVYDCESGNLM